ncbi:hypothetical protein L7F22_036996 [Adiantum nelumboides]|nr:hypothetical protein [Adiantum nelumboides]
MARIKTIIRRVGYRSRPLFPSSTKSSAQTPSPSPVSLATPSPATNPLSINLSNFNFSIPQHRATNTPAAANKVKKGKAVAHEGSSLGKDATTKVSINPLTLLEFSNEERQLLNQWGLTIVKEASTHQIHEGIVRQATSSFNKDNTTATVDGRELELTLAIVEHIFKIPNDPTLKSCYAKEFFIFLKEKPDQKQKRKVAGLLGDHCTSNNSTELQPETGSTSLAPQPINEVHIISITLFKVLIPSFFPFLTLFDYPVGKEASVRPPGRLRTQLLLISSKKSSSDEERTDTDIEQDSRESAQGDVPKEVEAADHTEYERSDEEDTSTPLEKRSQKPRIEKAKAIQKERRRIEAEKKAQEEAEATQTQEKEVIDFNGTVEYLKKLEKEKHTAEQRAAQLAREKLKEALSRKAEEPVLEPTQGSPKRPRQEEEEDIEHIQADPIPPSPINIPPAPPSFPITPFPHASTPRTPPSPSPLDPPKSSRAPTSPQQQQFSAEPIEVQSLQEETAQPMDKTEEEEKQTDSEQHKPADVDLQIPIIQLDEPTNEEAVEEVKNFDYTKLIQTLS